MELIATVDRAAIAASDTASGKAQDREVEALVQAHTAHLAALRSVADAAGLTLPETSRPRGLGARRGGAAKPGSGSNTRASVPRPISDGVVAQVQVVHREAMSQLRTFRNTALDRIFTDAMVAAHQQLLLMLTSTSTSLQTDALKAQATAMERTVARHLDRAKEIQKRLAPAAAADPTP